MGTISTFLWFDTQAEQAATLYTSLIDNSRVTDIARGPGDAVVTVGFELDGQRFVALNGGPHHAFSEATSVLVSCETQERVDELWSALTADGGQEGPCGWLKDRYGLSWQIIPTVLPALLTDPDPQRAMRAMTAMRAMSRIDIKALVDAADHG